MVATWNGRHWEFWEPHWQDSVHGTFKSNTTCVGDSLYSLDSTTVVNGAGRKSDEARQYGVKVTKKLLHGVSLLHIAPHILFPVDNEVIPPAHWRRLNRIFFPQYFWFLIMVVVFAKLVSDDEEKA